jgi:hypothetical protein
MRDLVRVSMWLGLLAAMKVAAAYEPKANYMLSCMGCHVEDGAGALGKVPSLRNTIVPFAQLAAGRRYLVQVPGTSQSALSNGEVAELLNWMMRNLSVRPIPPGLADFTEAEVASYRAQRLSDVGGARAKLLIALAAARATGGSRAVLNCRRVDCGEQLQSKARCHRNTPAVCEK